MHLKARLFCQLFSKQISLQNQQSSLKLNHKPILSTESSPFNETAKWEHAFVTHNIYITYGHTSLPVTHSDWQ